ncbi:MAG: hypothetical protein WC860_01965 [Candidatus Margulisiibacteriota bacterium]|jgi:ribonuclease HII
MYQIGLDEAGVGPVMGPMIVSGVLVEKTNLANLQCIGVKDSKKFSSLEQREKILKLSLPYLEKSATFEIFPEDLDNGNWIDLEIKVIAQILKELVWQDAEIIYIPQIGQLKFVNLISKLAIYNPEYQTQFFIDKVIYEVDADSKFLPVSLASMIAKTTRDQKMKELCKNLGEPYISGYPNKKTAIFLENYFLKHNALPRGIRKKRKWAPLQNLIME